MADLPWHKKKWLIKRIFDTYSQFNRFNSQNQIKKGSRGDYNSKAKHYAML
ncbi:hypothetical protein DCCM_3157 [Desulfocucumis palustris]|uniref:Uncharacterized protein n=1 Tax=Desulfocucumis palustris TaxID=1898651 RepID=A0A2L2XII6_9FIRM|nr:hypothetical protein DCCM_3157 [Desulfocucumis palustris]